MSFSQQLLRATQQQSQKSDVDIIKYSALIGLAGGLASSIIYYMIQRSFSSSGVQQDPIVMLKKELIKELRQYPIQAPKDEDYCFTKDFMLLLFKTLCTYQTIIQEVVKEQFLQKRLEFYKSNDMKNYTESIVQRTTQVSIVSIEVKDIIFDYFNIINKEYEMSFEKYKTDEEYTLKMNEIKKSIEVEYIDSKSELPPLLTKEKTQQIVDSKQNFMNQVIMRMMSEGEAQMTQNGQIGLTQSALMIEFMKFDDKLYLEEGFRREQVDKAVAHYQVRASEYSRVAPSEGSVPEAHELRAPIQSIEGEDLRASGQKIMLL